MEILKTEHLKKYYGKGETCVKALDDVNLTVEKGEFVSVVGTSGSGKSTLLNMLGGQGVDFVLQPKGADHAVHEAFVDFIAVQLNGQDNVLINI